MQNLKVGQTIRFTMASHGKQEIEGTILEITPKRVYVAYTYTQGNKVWRARGYPSKDKIIG